MFDPLLKTKLYIPRTSAEVVPRPRLIDTLNRGLRGKLMLVTAPAGFGKTTLVTEWLAQQDRPVGWLSLDGGDNNPIRFLRYLCTAAQQVDETVGQTLLGMLQAPELPPIATLMTSLINDLHGRPLIIVLDDYHLITEPIIHEGISFFLTHQAADTLMLITSRAELPFSVSRLRARRRLTEITVADLRFSQAETAQLITEALGRELAENDIIQLAERTEGWATGLHLAALSMRNQADISSFIDSFSGTDRYILDYLLDEVVEQQPADIQQFLFQTSVFERFSVELCEAIFENDTVTDLITYIGQNNLFLIPLDHEQHWFRYHHLFGDLLRNRLSDAGDVDQAKLYQKASRWFHREQLIDEAIHYALAGEDYDHAAELIETVAIHNLMHGANPGALHKQLEPLPAEIFEKYPRLYTARAWAALLMGRFDDVDHWLGTAQNSAAYQTDETLRRSIDTTTLTLQAILARGGSEVQKSIDLSQKALSLLPKENVQMRAFLYLGLGSSYNMRGDLPLAKRAASDILELVEEADSVFLLVQALLGWGEVVMRELDLKQAGTIFQQALTLLKENRMMHTPTAALLYIALGDIALDRYELDQAEAYYQQALDLAEPAVLVDGIMAATLGRVRLLAHKRAYAEAEQLTHKLFNVIDLEKMPLVHDQITAFLIWIKLYKGELDQVKQWVDDQGFSVDKPIRISVMDYLQWFNYELVYAAEMGNNDSLIPLIPFIDRLTKQAEEKQLVQRIFMLTLYKSLIYKQLGEGDLAFEAFRIALSMAAPQAYQLWFMIHGRLTIPLLQDAKQNGIETEFVERLLRDWKQISESSSEVVLTAKLAPTSSDLLADPLTERETEILGLIAEGLSTRATAERLFVAPGTVKWHINNIYSKLAANNRVQAIARAKELNLIS